MDQRISENMRERTRRPIRNKRYNRRNFGEEKRPTKRLFTPEIKRFLKDWLVRRRENPYPNRDEKKTLAIQTGLTYIQVCNWFANWRRKLKNAGKEPQRKTWGHLIKTYNSQVQGNVEHFSICSDDSIWQDSGNSPGYENETNRKYEFENCSFRFDSNDIKNHNYKNSSDHCYTVDEKNSEPQNNNNNTTQPQCFFISSTTENDFETNPFSQPANKYKSHIMEKYLRDCQKPENHLSSSADSNKYEEEISKPSIVLKWRESAANFQPSENNYLHWTLTNNQKKKNKKLISNHEMYQQHGREELDAAETLTRLANAHSSKV